jgi:hypothetical protein
VTLSSANIRVSTDYGDEDGLLIFVDDALVAVISLLQHEMNGEWRGQWFLEAGFGRCCGPETAPLFDSAQSAQDWILEQLAKPRRQSGHLES